jgi:hypothetical protein
MAHADISSGDTHLWEKCEYLQKGIFLHTKVLSLKETDK